MGSSLTVARDGQLVEVPESVDARLAADARFKALVAERVALTPKKEAYVFMHGTGSEFGDNLHRAQGPVVPPREVRRAQPERVRIPAPPIVDKQGKQDAVEKGPPARPDDEQKHMGEAKDKPKGKDERQGNRSD